MTNDEIEKVVDNLERAKGVLLMIKNTSENPYLTTEYKSKLNNFCQGVNEAIEKELECFNQPITGTIKSNP